MPATAARWGRVPGSRRAAIRISAGVRTLTTTAWTRVAVDDYRGGETVVRRAGWPWNQRPFRRCAVGMLGTLAGPARWLFTGTALTVAVALGRGDRPRMP